MPIEEWDEMRSMKLWAMTLVMTCCVGLVAARMGAAQTATPRAAGTVKSVDANGVTVTTAAGADAVVSVPATAKVLLVAPGSKDLKSATPGALSDVVVGDRVIVNGTDGDTAVALHATRVIVMKATAIAQTHAAEDAAWARGSGGIVKAVSLGPDAGTGTITVASGLKTLTVTTTPATVVRRYSGESVRFADATVSTLAAVKPGDQMRVRGTKNADGTAIAADAVVAGTFRNYSGLLTAVDAAAGTVTLKDLVTKRPVTVSVTANSDVRRIPAQMAQMVAMRMKGGAATSAVGSVAPGTSAGGPVGAGGTRRAGADLSQMLSRLPTETLAGLKAGDAVMIVATATAADAAKSTAVTLLAGVDAILSASPEGQATTLSPWSLGGGEGGGDGGGGPQ